VDLRTETKRIKQCGALIAAFLFLTQCESPHYYQEKQSVEKYWHKDSALTFNFEVHDTADTYTLSFLSRNTNEYPYSNFYIFTKLINPKGEEFTDTLQYYLAFQDGEWIGKGQNLKELYLVYRENVPLKDTGKYKLSVWHGMRDENLTGIRDISLIVDKNNPK